MNTEISGSSHTHLCADQHQYPALQEMTSDCCGYHGQRETAAPMEANPELCKKMLSLTSESESETDQNPNMAGKCIPEVGQMMTRCSMKRTSSALQQISEEEVLELMEHTDMANIMEYLPPCECDACQLGDEEDMKPTTKPDLKRVNTFPIFLWVSGFSFSTHALHYLALQCYNNSTSTLR